MGDVAEVIAGQSPPSSTYNMEGDGLPFFQGKAEFGRDFPATVKWCSKPTKVAEEGDILISVRAPVGPTNFAPERCGIGRGLSAIRSKESSSKSWLRHWLAASQGMLVAQATGTTFEAITGGVLRSHPVPIPPIETQKRIVARIDELFTELDDGEAALERARDDLDIYRKSLLKAAVTGELTAEWRAANPPQETGEQLLQRILAAHRSRWETRTRNNGKRYKEPRAVDQNNLPALPEGWTWLALDQLLDGIEAGKNVKALGRPPETGETGIVKVSSVTWWDFDENASKTLTSDADYSPSSLIQSGDMLVSRANTLELVGAPAIVRQLNRRLVLSDKVLRLLMPREFKAWVFYVLRSSFGRTQIEARSTGNQLSMRNISQDSLRSLAIPLPPLEELSVALKMAADCLSDGAELASGSDRYLGSASELRQSILASAFKGELVS